MALIHFSLAHGRTLPEAQDMLRQTVDEVQRKLSLLLKRVEWSHDHSAVLLAGAGFELKLSVDDQKVYLEGDVPMLAKLLGSPAIAGIKQMLEQKFQKKLQS